MNGPEFIRFRAYQSLPPSPSAAMNPPTYARTEQSTTTRSTICKRCKQPFEIVYLPPPSNGHLKTPEMTSPSATTAQSTTMPVPVPLPGAGVISHYGDIVTPASSSSSSVAGGAISSTHLSSPSAAALSSGVQYLRPSTPPSSWMLSHEGRKVVEAKRDPTACRFHPEAYSQETAQRWLEPGSTENGSRTETFWTCCGAAAYDAPGCRTSWHITFDEEDTICWM
ncbi:unnamed protein product [Amoebophrya sp. A25]|nr:unnamed protein product [Amoebophrya sp. A25]|eukprot:GSA25T00012210001.1